jgi:transposase
MVLTQAASGLLFGMPRSLQRSLPPQGFFRVIVMHLTMRFGPTSLQGAIRNRLKKGPEGSAREDTEHDEKSIQSDLSDAEWAYLELHLPDPKPGGRPRVHTVREILDAVFYVTTWRAVAAPGAYFPPWKTVYHTTSGYGASTACGSVCTSHFAAGRVYDSGGTRNRASESLIRSRGKPPGWARRSAATTRARR